MIQVSAANSLGIKRFPHFAIFAGIGGGVRTELGWSLRVSILEQ